MAAESKTARIEKYGKYTAEPSIADCCAALPSLASAANSAGGTTRGSGRRK